MQRNDSSISPVSALAILIPHLYGSNLFLQLRKTIPIPKTAFLKKI
jgi:hypothetical protein